MNKIAEYKFNNTLYDLIPEFNAEFTDYTYEDAVEEGITTRTIYSIDDSLPTMIKFGGDIAAYQLNPDKFNSLSVVLYVNTSNIADMSYMFSQCRSLQTVYSSDWDTSNVTNMNSMFAVCLKLTSIDVSNWDISKASDMGNMFVSCYELTSLDVSKWDTSNVTNMSRMFDVCYALTTIDVSKWDTSNVTNMNSTFSTCESLASIDVSNWDISNVNSMNNMFNGCKSLTSLDVSNWDTNNVNSMSAIFSNCKELTSLDVSNWDTNNVTDMNKMFANCKSLTSIDVSNWGTNNVTNMSAMFYNCESLTSLDAINWDTNNVTDMSFMFYGCKSLTSLVLSNFDTSNVTDMSFMFNTCDNLNIISMSKSDYNSVNKIIEQLPTRTADNPGTLDITRGVSDISISQINIDTAEAKYWTVALPNKIAEYKFNNTLYDLIPEFNAEFTDYTYEDLVEEGVTTRTIYSIDLPTMIRFGGDLAAYKLNPNKFDSLLVVIYINTSNIDNMSYMFSQCRSLQTVYSSDWDTSNVTDMSSMFAACLKLASIDVSNWNTGNVTNMKSMFASCYKLTTLDVSKWDTSKVIDMYSLFDYSHKLTSLDVSNWDTSNVTNMGRVFRNCQSLTTIDVSNWDTSNVTTMEGMFISCNKLASLDVSKWDVGNVTDMSNMFGNCDKLTSLDLSNFDINNVTTMHSMFFGCTNLTSLDVSSFDTSNVTTMTSMFQNCNNLISLDVSSFDTSNVTTMRYMFYNCKSLTSLDLSNFDTSNVTDMAYMFDTCDNLNNILMSNSDYNSVNKVIEQLPTRTADNPGTLDMTRGVSGMRQLNMDVAEAKYWTVAVPKITEYKFNSTIETLPSFNEGLVYEYSDIDNGDGTITRTIIAESLPTYMLFYDCTGLLEILYLNTDGLTSGNWMFGGCVNLTSINTFNMNTSRLTDMSYMFFNCEKLTSLDVSNFDTSNVSDMSYMFMRCKAITSLDVSKWDVSNVTNMYSLFAFCEKLTTIGDVSNWNTGNVVDMSQMFNSTKKLTSLDVSKWDTSNVTNMYLMFQNCRVPELDVSNFNTSNVTNIGGMFNGCTNVLQLDVSKWDTSNVTDMSAGVFGSCKKVTELDLSNWNTGKVTVMNAMFNSCSILTTIGDVSKWDTSNVTDMRSLFNGCSNLLELNLSGWNTSKVTKMNTVFNNCSSIEKLNLSNWTLTDDNVIVTNMFAGCNNLRELNISNLCKTIKPELLSLEANTSIRELNLFNWSNDNIGHLLINNQLPGNISAYSLRARAVGDDERTVYSRYISNENKNVLSELGWGVVVPKLVDTAGVKKIAKAVKDIAKAELEVEVLRATNVEAELQAQIDEIEINCDNKASKEELQEVEAMLGGRAIIYITQVEYDMLTEEEKNDKSKTYFVTDAVDLSHDHENKEFLDGLNQEIIDNKQDKEDINLATENKNIVGAINEINEALSDVSAEIIELDTNKIDKAEVETLLNNKSDIIEFNAGKRIEKDFAGIINSNLNKQFAIDYPKIDLVIGNDYIIDISIDVTDNEGNVTTLNDNRIVSAEAYNAEGSVLLNILDGKIMIIDKALLNLNSGGYYENFFSVLFNELIQTYGNNIVVKKLDIVEADYRQINSELFSSGDFHLLSNAEKQTIGNVLTKDNAESYTPTNNYNPATKLYVDSAILNARPLYDVSDVVEPKVYDYSDVLPFTLGEGISYFNIPNHINITQGVKYNIECSTGPTPNSNGGLGVIGSAIAKYDENKDCLVLDFGDNVMIFVDVYYNEEDGTFSKNENNHVYTNVPIMDYHYINKLKLTASDATPVCDEFLKVFKFVTEEEKAKWNNMDAITLNGYSLWVGTTAELEAIGEKDPNTLYFELDDGTTEDVVQVDVVDGVLNLTDDKYQKTNMINGTELVFPNVNKFTEIHLYFDADEDMNLTFPDCKWRVEPNIEEGNSYEIVATYNTIHWLVNVIVYS